MNVKDNVIWKVEDALDSKYNTKTIKLYVRCSTKKLKWKTQIQPILIVSSKILSFVAASIAWVTEDSRAQQEVDIHAKHGTTSQFTSIDG